jgi:hypothetical protein
VGDHVPYTRCIKCMQKCATKSGICSECNRPRAKARFLKAFNELGTVGAAASFCKVAPSTFYRWVKYDKEFFTRYLDEQRIRRDKYIELLCRVAGGTGEKTVETFRENGHEVTREVPRPLPPGQLRAILNVLKATDHIGGPAKMFIFSDKRRETQFDLADQPKRIEYIEIHDAPPRVD